jgi:hypothetical protein
VAGITFNVVGEGVEKGKVGQQLTLPEEEEEGLLEAIAPWEGGEGATAPQALRDHSEAEVEVAKTEGAHLLVGVEVFVDLLEAEVVLPPRYSLLQTHQQSSMSVCQALTNS